MRKSTLFFCHELQFHSCLYSACLCVKRDVINVLLASLNAHELLITAYSHEAVEEIESKLSSGSEMVEFEEVKIFDGPKSYRHRSVSRLKLNQKPFHSKVLAFLPMLDAEPSQNSVVEHLSNVIVNNQKFCSATYPHHNDSLIYLMICALPEIAFAVGRLSHFIEIPASSVWTCLKRVFGYLSGAKNNQTTFSIENCDLHLVIGCSNLDRIVCKLDKKSTSGYIIKIAAVLVFWKSNQQTVVAILTDETGNMALLTVHFQSLCIARV